MKLCANTLLGLGVQALAEAFTLGEKGGLSRERLAQVLSETAVVSPSQRSKLENVRKDEYPSRVPAAPDVQRLRVDRETAMELSVPMPATAAAVQVAAPSMPGNWLRTAMRTFPWWSGRWNGWQPLLSSEEANASRPNTQSLCRRHSRQTHDHSAGTGCGTVRADRPQWRSREAGMQMRPTKLLIFGSPRPAPL